MPVDIGQRIMKVFTLANSGSVASLPVFCEDNKHDCDFVLPAYADASGEELKNDKFSFLVMGSTLTSSITLVLQKLIGATWTNQATITDNTYGTFKALGSYTSKPKYSGILIEWANVLAAFGQGQYRIKSTEVIPTGSNITYSKPSCLKEWTCTPDNTVRLEWYMNKGIGDIDNDKNILDFSDLNWYMQIRLPNSFFGYPKSSYEREEIQYTNGQFEDVISTQEETYQLKIGSIPAWLHNILKALAFQSGTLLITDYSSNNPQEIIQKAMKLSSGYEPRYSVMSKCAPVTVELKPTYNRLELFRCL